MEIDGSESPQYLLFIIYGTREICQNSKNTKAKPRANTYYITLLPLLNSEIVSSAKLRSLKHQAILPIINLLGNIIWLENK